MATKDKAVDTGERIKALFAQVEAGVKGVYESDNYRKYLSAMSKFHTYSFRNTLLILAQHPDATRVAGYNAWQDKFNRHVRKGEKGITILGYTPRTITTIQEKKDDSGKVMTGPDGKPATEKVERKVPAFTPVYVFDISQTEGDPLPQLVHNLEGEVDGFKKLMAALEHVSPFPIQFEEIEGGARGYCNPTAQRIAIRQGMSEAQTIKTAIHEITHAYLHGPGIDRDRHTEEVEAESVAFIVSDHYGIDTSDYSFPYLASWSSGRELAELTASLDTIQHKAFELIEGIDAQLRELTMEQELTEEQPGIGEWSEPTTAENAPEIPGVSSDDVGAYLPEDGNTFSIYQLKAGDETRHFRFEPYERLQSAGLTLDPKNYELTYTAPLESGMDLEGIFKRFNLNRPADFTGHSLSVSDVVVLHQNGQDTAHYVDRFGYKDAPEFLQAVPAPVVEQPQEVKGIKAVMASAQARAEERAAARTEAKAQMSLSPDGRREM